MHNLRLIFFLLVTLPVIFLSSSICDELITSEDLLNWLPMDNYSRLEHSDLMKKLDGTEAGKNLTAVFGMSIKQRIAEFPIPYKLTGDVEAFIRAHFGNNKVLMNEEVRKYKPGKQRVLTSRKVFKDKQGKMQSILIINGAIEAWVFRISPESKLKSPTLTKKYRDYLTKRKMPLKL